MQLVTAMLKPMAEGLFRLFKGVSLRLMLLTFTLILLENDQWNCFRRRRKENWAKNIALVDFGIKKTNVTLFSNGKYVFNSIIDYGERNLHDIVKNSAGIADKLNWRKFTTYWTERLFR